MALSEQQKASNKAARLVRDRAHTARCREYQQAKDRAAADASVVAAKVAANEASARLDALSEERNAQIKRLRNQIAELQEQIEALERPDAAIVAAKEQRSSAYDHWRRLLDEKTAQVDKLFADVSGDARFSAALWQPPQEVLDAMDEASRNATPESMAAKKSKRA